MARGLIAKALRGAAAVAAPIHMANLQAKIQAERDARLQEYAQQNMQAQQQFQSQERQAGQAFTAEQNQLDRTQRAQEFEVSTGLQREQVGMERQRLGMEQQRLDMAVKQADQALESGALELEQQRQVQDLRKIIFDPAASDEEKQTAADRLLLLNGGDAQNVYSPITAFGDEDEVTGQQSRRTGIINRRTGAVNWLNPSAGAGTIPTPQTQDEYDALPSGTIYIDPDDGKQYRKP